MTQSTRYIFQKSRGVFFLGSPKRRRQLGHRRTGLGDLKTGNKNMFSGNRSFPDLKNQNLEMCLGACSTCQKSQVLETYKSENQVLGASVTPGDLIWVTLGQDTYCIVMLCVCKDVYE